MTEAAITAPLTDGIIYLAPGSDLTQFDTWVQDKRNGKLALDTETTGLDTSAAGFAVIQLAFGCSEGTAFVLDASDAPMCQAALIAAVRSGRKIWAHNATYDTAAILSGLRLRVRNLRCSLVLMRTIRPAIIRAKGGSLKTLRPNTRRALRDLTERWEQMSGSPVSSSDEHEWLSQAVRRLGPADPALVAYAATDAIECARMVAECFALLPRRVRVAVNVETRTEDIWRSVASRGVAVDRGLLLSKGDEVDTARRESVSLHELDLTVTSDQVRRWVQSRGIRITDQEGFATLSHKHWDRAYVPQRSAGDWDEFKRIRTLGATATKLTEIVRHLAESHDGRLHPSIKGIGAHTGRMSITKPALQNLPADLRPILVADPGSVLIGCDLDRVEPRVLAALSQDANLIAAVQADVYTELAVQVWGESTRGDDARRKTAKTAFLAMIYGQGASSLSLRLGVPVTEAEQVLSGIRTGYPTMAAWMSDIKRRARDGKEVTTVYGRPLPPTPEAPFRAVNWVVQGSAADLFKRLTLEVVAQLGNDALYLPVHDELVVQVPVSSQEAAFETLKASMNCELEGVPITGSPAVLGQAWGKA